MLLPNRSSDSDQGSYNDFFTLLAKLSGSNLKAETFYDWLIGCNTTELEMFDRHDLLGRSRYKDYIDILYGHDREKYYNSTISMTKNYLSTFTAEDTYELLDVAYTEIGKSTATHNSKFSKDL